jgi:serine/threonine protein kinase
MSLFLLMKRYNCTLREYLENAGDELDIRTRIILFTQLLEAVAFINNFQVAHRDIKSDNILIDIMSDSLPILVLSDFGCCLADKKHGLRLPYTSHEIDKGGNVQLLAPEIITKEPSMFSILDYRKSDLFAVGALAYEIFGYSNPFYNSDKTIALKNTDYNESMLPLMDEKVPLIVRKLIQNLLQRNPAKRLNCDVAANVLEIYLWAPSAWIKYGRNPSNAEILEWLLTLTTKVLCERGLGSINENFMAKSRRCYTEYVLISTFLSRAKLENIRKALNWIKSSVQ